MTASTGSSWPWLTGDLGDRDKARIWFDRAVQWMDRHKPHDDELCRFRAEAEAMLADPGQR